MRYDQAIILTDLDGTLFNSQGNVSEDDRAAICEFIAGGGYFGVGTGREPRNARLHLPDVLLNGPSIVLNGAAIYDFVQDRYISSIPMDKDAALDVLLHCMAENWPLDIQVYTPDGIYYATPIETADPGFLRIHQPTIFLPIEQLVKKTWIKTVLLERKEGALAPMRAYLKKKGYDKHAFPNAVLQLLLAGKTDFDNCSMISITIWISNLTDEILNPFSIGKIRMDCHRFNVYQRIWIDCTNICFCHLTHYFR